MLSQTSNLFDRDEFCKYESYHSTPAINHTIVRLPSQQQHIDGRTVMIVTRESGIGAAATILCYVVVPPSSSVSSQYHINKVYSLCHSDTAGYEQTTIGKPESPLWIVNECLNWCEHKTARWNYQQYSDVSAITAWS